MFCLGGPYTGNANKSGGGAAADLTNAMYAKTHVALNKVNVSTLVVVIIVTARMSQTVGIPASERSI